MNKKNLANAQLLNDVTETQTTIEIKQGQGADMPPVPFHATITPLGLLSTIDNSEIVLVTDVSLSDVLTVERGQRGTTPKFFTKDSVLSNGVYAEDIDSKAESSALTSHTSDTNNPHSVTKAQLGLDNVENLSRTEMLADVPDGINPQDAVNKGQLDEKASHANADITVTVGAGGDYATVNEAIEHLSKTYATYTKDGFRAVVNLLSGFTMSEQVSVRGVDLGWITIESADPAVTIQRAALTEAYHSSWKPAFYVEGGVLPAIDVLFNMDTSGSASNQCGIVAVGSTVLVKPGGGVTNATLHGMYILDSSRGVAGGAIFSGAGNRSELTPASVVGSEVASAIGNGITAANGSILSAPNVTADDCGSYGILISFASQGHLANAQANNCGHHGLLVTGGSTAQSRNSTYRYTLDDNVVIYAGSSADLRGSNMSNAVVNHGIVVTRSSSANLEDATINSCGSDNVACVDSSTINMARATSTGSAADNIKATYNSRINADSATLTGASRNAVLAYEGGFINVNNANLRNAGNRGIECTRGSHVNAMNAIATGTGSEGFAVYSGSFINARGSSGSYSQGANVFTGSGAIMDTDSGQTRVASGSVSIVPSGANTPTSQRVNFPSGRFSGTPAVTVTPATSVPGTTVVGAGATAPSSSGFTAWVTRTNTTSTTLYWIAVQDS